MGPFDADLVTAAVALTTPILFAAMGELIAERAGVIDIGLEGMMLMGAFWALWVAWTTGNLLLGVASGMAAGMLLGAVMAALAIRGRADQIVVGLGINVLAAGLTSFGNVQLLTRETQVTIDPIQPLGIPGIEHLPVIGEALFQQVPLAYVAYLLVPLTWWVLYRTNWGLLIRAAGEAPDAVETAGASVVRVRALATLFAAGMAGLGGAMLSIGNLGVFNDGMTAGRGFLALAAVIVGRWRPLPVLGACLLFGGADALQLRLQSSPAIASEVWLLLALTPLVLGAWALAHGRRLTRAHVAYGTALLVAGLALALATPPWDFPSELWLMLPYVVTLLVLAGFAGRARVPAALGRPYARSAAGT